MENEAPYDIEKSIYWSLKAIEQLHVERAYKIISPNTPLNNQLGTIEKQANNDFLCKICCEDLIEPIEGKKNAGYGAFEDIYLESDEGIYYIRAKSVLEITRSLNTPSLLKFRLTHFQKGRTENFDNQLLRLIIPVKAPPNLTALTNKRLKIETYYLASGLVEVAIDNQKYHLYKSLDDNVNYVVIESIGPVLLSAFIKASDSIITGYALISGNLHLGEYYYHVINDDFNSDELLIYEKKEPAVITNITLLNHKAFKSHLENTTSSKEYLHYCIPMSEDIFSALCQMANDNSVYARCCRFIIESHQSKQVLLKGGIYSISIETIANIIYDQNHDRINPIEDKALAKKITTKIREVVGEYYAFFTDYGKAIIDTKINNLNSPTNAKKLSKPFELFGIILPDEGVTILNTRNKFLHGESPLGDNEAPDKSEELEAIVNKLLFMLMVLMLKHIGYSGHIIHYPDWVKYRYTSPYSEKLFFII